MKPPTLDSHAFHILYIIQISARFVFPKSKNDCMKVAQFQKDLNQFFNTLKLIKNNKKEKELEVRAFCKGLPSITPLNWEIGYGDFHKTRKYQGKCDPIKNTIKYVIEIGKQAFGEKKLKKPISDLEKHRISQDIIKMDNEYRLG